MPKSNRDSIVSEVVERPVLRLLREKKTTIYSRCFSGVGHLRETRS